MKQYRICRFFLGITLIVFLAGLTISCEKMGGLKPEYTVSFDTQGGIPEVPKQDVTEGYHVSFPDTLTKKTNYYLAYWYVGNDDTKPFDFLNYPVTTNITLKAKWVPGYIIAYDGNDSKSTNVPIPLQGVVPGATISGPIAQPSTTTANANFNGWFKDLAGAIPFRFNQDTIMGNRTLYAKWSTTQCMVNFESNISGAVATPAAVLVAKGGKIAPPDNPTRAGFTFVSWHLRTDWYNPVDFANTSISSNTTFFAKWASSTEVVTDASGNIYHTVKIGNQIWMVENLATQKYNDGTAILNITTTAQVDTLTRGNYLNYPSPNDPKLNGRLYNFYAVKSGKLCPAGWHVPSEAEWQTLITTIGGADVAGRKLKQTTTINSTATLMWNIPFNPAIQRYLKYEALGNASTSGFEITDATNETGFTAFPAGYYYKTSNNYLDFHNSAAWWTSTESGAKTAKGCSLNYFSPKANLGGDNNKTVGLSVRCVKD